MFIVSRKWVNSAIKVGGETSQSLFKIRFSSHHCCVFSQFVPLLTSCGTLSNSMPLNILSHNQGFPTGGRQPIHRLIYCQCYCCCCSVTKSCPTLRDLTDCSTPGFPVPHHLLEFVQVHVHWISDAIQLSHPLLPSSPTAFNLSQHQGLFQWVGCSHQVAKVLELQLPSFQWIFRIDFL